MNIRTSFVILSCLTPLTSQAFTVYDSFGSFADATWGGSGIPNDAVAASKTIVDGDTTIRVAMAATERFSNPPVSDNGAAIYQAGTGSNFGGNNESSSEGALWNWNYFIDISNPNDPNVKLTDYQIDLYYDLDPAGPTACCNVAGLGRIDVTAVLNANDPNATLSEDSQNNMFGYLATGVPGFVYAPGGTFDPDAVGNYQFAMTVSSGTFGIESVAMEVNVVPVPAAAWLFGSALMGLTALRRKRS